MVWFGGLFPNVRSSVPGGCLHTPEPVFTPLVGRGLFSSQTDGCGAASTRTGGVAASHRK